MNHRGKQFPGYIIQEMLDAPRHYSRYLVVDEDTQSQWSVVRALSRDLVGTAEIRLYYQDACRHFGRVHVDGLFNMREIGVNRFAGVYAVYAYEYPYLSFGELDSIIHKYGLNVDGAFYASVLLDAVRIIDEAYQNGLEYFSTLPCHIVMSNEGDVYVTGYVDALMRRKFHFETEMNEHFDAPEWRRHESVGIESDVYTIGALLYQSLTGEFQPDEWEPRWMGMMDVLDRSGLPGDSLAPLTDFFHKTLAERPKQRFSTYSQLAQALEQITHEFGSYTSRDLRAELFKGFFAPFPPQYVRDSSPRNDVINLISSDTAALPLNGLAENTPNDVFAADSSEDLSLRSTDVSLDDTLASGIQEVVMETRVIRTGSFRTVSPGLRSSITLSPLEILSHSRYQVLEHLGTGGTGSVYKVLDTTLTEVLALKVLRPELVSDSAWLERFKRELKITRDLEHAYILPAYHMEQLEGLYFFTMRYIDGKNLSELLHDETPIPLIICTRILMQIAEALVAAHDRGVIHRDLKPANVMIESETYHPYLMDFGIASMLDAPGITLAGQGIGTPSYMAPEQSRGEYISTQADIYSFGVLCYECFTHTLPFTGPTAVAIYTAQMSGIFRPIRDINPSVPESIAHLAEQCLSPNASSRPGSMRVVLDGFR